MFHLSPLPCRDISLPQALCGADSVPNKLQLVSTDEINPSRSNVGLTAPHAIVRRAREIKALCGFADASWPYRPLNNLSVREMTALRADGALIHLIHARNHLHFLKPRAGGLHRGSSVASMRWHYRAYARDRVGAHRSIRIAAKYLQEAETMFAALPIERRAAP